MTKEYIKCEFCKSELLENTFYKIITEKRNERTGEYEPYTVCKKCVMRDYFLNQTSVFQHDVNYICKKYNLYYDINIVDRIVNSDNKEYKIGHYIKEISSLRQYIDKKYKDSVFLKDNDNDINIEEKSDIDFINDDIQQLKKNIEKAIQKEDFNAHNKWMNCLRDAIELREKLNNNRELTIQEIDNLTVDYGIEETIDQHEENICRIPIFINGHFIKSIFVKYVDGEYQEREYFIDKLT